MTFHKEPIRRLLNTIYHSLEGALDHHLFEPNLTESEYEFAIQNTALAFNAPNFIALTIGGVKYGRDQKSDFIEDMRMRFADDKNFVIDGIFEYKIDPQPPVVILDFKGTWDDLFSVKEE